MGPVTIAFSWLVIGFKELVYKMLENYKVLLSLLRLTWSKVHTLDWFSWEFSV